MNRYHYILLLIFILVFSSSQLVSQNIAQTEKIETEYATIVLTVTTDSVRIQNAKPGTTLEIYTVLGVRINAVLVDSTDKTIFLTLPRGYYIFKIDNIVRKVVVK